MAHFFLSLTFLLCVFIHSFNTTIKNIIQVTGHFKVKGSQENTYSEMNRAMHF